VGGEGCTDEGEEVNSAGVEEVAGKVEGTINRGGNHRHPDQPQVGRGEDSTAGRRRTDGGDKHSVEGKGTMARQNLYKSITSLIASDLPVPTLG